MARRNRYSGVLQPRMLGRGAPATSLLVLYDIEDNRVRTRVSNVCLDYGLERIQFSAFLGKLDRNRREELCLRMRSEIESNLARVRVIPVCEADLKTMWLLDQYSLPVDVEEHRKLPKLRVIEVD